MKRISGIDVFLCFNPMADIYINAVVRKRMLRDYIVVEFYTRKIITSVPEDKLVSFITNSSGISYFFQLMKYRRFIKEISHKYDRITFYFCHPHHITSNYVFFANNPNYDYNLIPDGMSNYCHAPNVRSFKRLFLKKIVAHAVGMRYTGYKGHITAFESNRYSVVFTLHPKGLVTKCGIVEQIRVSLESKTEGKQKKALILGQGEGIVGKAYPDMVIEMAKYVRACGFDNVFYKHHPESKLQASLGNTLDKQGVKVLEAPMAAERLAGQYQAVISPYSSALLNLKVIYSDALRCISYIDYKFWVHEKQNKQISEIIPLFRKLGIETIEKKRMESSG